LRKYSGALTNAHWVARSNGSETLARVVLAALAGVLASLLGFLAMRFARPERRVEDEVRGLAGTLVRCPRTWPHRRRRDHHGLDARSGT